MNKDWIRQTNIYEVNTRQYTPEGTLNAFAAHLPRLKKMGVQTLWFMPLTPIAQKNKKGSLGSPYACSDYTALSPELGTLKDFKALVKKAQGMGFKVIIDWVANHTGWDHVWTVQHPEWYLKDEATGDFKKASGMDDIIELDYRNREMRQAMIAAMTWWVKECRIDGFRCDLASWVEVDFWIEAKTALDKVKPLFWLAEADALEHPEYMQVFDAAYSWTWMHRTETFYKSNEKLASLLPLLHRYSSAPGIPAWFTSNHDENTWNGTEYEKYGDAARMLAVFSCTWPGVPLVYGGQELPLKKRLEFFEKDDIPWKEELLLHDFYATLLHLQSGHPALRSDSLVTRVHTSADEQVLCFLRKEGKEEVLVLLNFTALALRFEMYDHGAMGTYADVFGGEGIDLSLTRWLQLPAWGYRVFRR